MKKAVDFKFIVGLIIMVILLAIVLMVFLNPLKSSAKNAFDSSREASQKLEEQFVDKVKCINFLDVNLLSISSSDVNNLDYVINRNFVHIKENCTQNPNKCEMLKTKMKLYCKEFNFKRIGLEDISKTSNKYTCFQTSSCNLVDQSTSCSVGSGSSGTGDEIYFIKIIPGTNNYFAITAKKR
ncbi:MAG: hypothetical protein QXS41_03885 [Candidatus Woesearchaeota archaeon]